jgi:3-(3-hydroxy-phenyl)propionate hydroxylase
MQRPTDRDPASNRELLEDARGSRLTSARDYAVIIVGLGPVGATAANLLGKMGIPTACINIGETPCASPRAVHFDSEILRVFQAVDLAREAQAISEAIEGVQFRNAKGGLLFEVRADELALENGYRNANMFYQPALERILWEGAQRYEAIEWLTGYEVEDLIESDSGVVVRVRHQRSRRMYEMRCQYVLGCDGARSTVRKKLGAHLRSFRYEQPWLVIDALEHSPRRLGRLPQQVCDPRRPVSVVPSAGRHFRWEFMVMPGDDPLELQTEGGASTLLRPWCADASFEVIRRTVYTFHALVAHRWSSSRLFLLGDAAHQMPPFLGQGMCAGIRDAHNLCWKLRLVLKRHAHQALLGTYQTEREPHVVAVIRLAIRAGRVIQTTSKTKALARDWMFGIVTAVPFLNKRLSSVSIPGIGRGVRVASWNDKASGRMIPQPWVRVDGRCLRLDSVLGEGFALLCIIPEPLARLSAELREFLSKLEVRVIRVRSTEDVRLHSPRESEPTVQEPGRGDDHATEIFEHSVGATIDLEDSSGALLEWMRKNRCDAVLVRPDRYVHSAVRQHQLEGAVRKLRSAIRLPGA